MIFQSRRSIALIKWDVIAVFVWFVTRACTTQIQQESLFFSAFINFFFLSRSFDNLSLFFFDFYVCVDNISQTFLVTIDSYLYKIFSIASTAIVISHTNYTINSQPMHGHMRPCIILIHITYPFLSTENDLHYDLRRNNCRHTNLHCGRVPSNILNNRNGV